MSVFKFTTLNTKFASFIILLTVIANYVECYKLLGLFPHAGKSHFDVFEPLFLELAKRGHNVTIIGHFPQTKPVENYHDVSLVGTIPILTNMIPFGMIGGGTVARLRHMLELADFTNHVCKDAFKSEDVQEFMRKKEKYDVVLTEFFTPNCLVGLMHYTGGSLIGVTSSMMMPWTNDFVGNPDHPAYIPSVYIGCSDQMNFWDRIVNVVFYLWTRSVYKYLMDLPANIEARNQIVANLADLNQFAYNTSLILSNVHHSLHGSRPLVPGVIEVGGMHIREKKKLPVVSKFICDGNKMVKAIS